MTQSPTRRGAHVGEIEWFDDLGVRVCLNCGDVELVDRGEEHGSGACSGWLPFAERAHRPLLNP